ATAESTSLAHNIGMLSGQQDEEPSDDSALSAAFSPRWLLLRQNLFDQLEYRRQVLVLRSGQIEIFLAFFQAVVRIDVVFWNIDAAGNVGRGADGILAHARPLPGQQPYFGNICRR